MHIVSLLLFMLAAIIFAVDFFLASPVRVTTPRRYQTLVSLGLCVLTVGFIVQFLTLNHPVHF
jgi:uncharacterized YccA/Bax inhibitor family protein